MFADLKFKFKFKDFLNLPIQAAAIGHVSLHLTTLAWRHLSRAAPVARPETQKTVTECLWTNNDKYSALESRHSHDESE